MFRQPDTQGHDGPVIGGWYPLANISLGIALNVQSGYPYTPIEAGDRYSEVFKYNNPKFLGTYNSARMPWLVNLDLKISKALYVGPLKLEAYLWLLNALDSQSYTRVFRQTGNPDTDGWLLTEKGIRTSEENGEDFVNWYNAVLTGCGSFGYQPPRQARLGLRFEI